MMAGLRYGIGGTCVVIDVDSQDPPDLIPVFYRRLQKGYDVVLSKRRSENEPLVRKLISFVSYRVINAALADVEIPHDTGEFRIMNRRHRRIVPPEGEAQFSTQPGHVCLIQLGFLTVGLQRVAAWRHQKRSRRALGRQG